MTQFRTNLDRENFIPHDPGDSSHDCEDTSTCLVHTSLQVSTRCPIKGQKPFVERCSCRDLNRIRIGFLVSRTSLTASTQRESRFEENSAAVGQHDSPDEWAPAESDGLENQPTRGRGRARGRAVVPDVKGFRDRTSSFPTCARHFQYFSRGLRAPFISGHSAKVWLERQAKARDPPLTWRR